MSDSQGLARPHERDGKEHEHRDDDPEGIESRTLGEGPGREDAGDGAHVQHRGVGVHPDAPPLEEDGTHHPGSTAMGVEDLKAIVGSRRSLACQAIHERDSSYKVDKGAVNPLIPCLRFRQGAACSRGRSLSAVGWRRSERE